MNASDASNVQSVATTVSTTDLSSPTSSSSSSPNEGTIFPTTYTSALLGDQTIVDYITALPKTELHVHFEGTLTPTQVLNLAKKNKCESLIPYTTVEEGNQRRSRYSTLQDFLDELDLSCQVLITEEDFTYITIEYLSQVVQLPHNCKYVEFQVGPQVHTSRGISVATCLTGIAKGIHYCEEKYGIYARIILTFVKHFSIEDSEKVLDEALALPDSVKQYFMAAGLAGAELNIPHSKFSQLMTKAVAHSLTIVAHCGEEGGPEYVHDALEAIHVARIDHGVQSIKDPKVLEKLKSLRIGLCVCPISNEQLHIYDRFLNNQHPLRGFLDAGVRVCLSSDDPAFFNHGLFENYICATLANKLTKMEIWSLAVESFQLSFGIPEDAKRKYLQVLDSMKPEEM